MLKALFHWNRLSENVVKAVHDVLNTTFEQHKKVNEHVNLADTQEGTSHTLSDDEQDIFADAAAEVTQELVTIDDGVAGGIGVIDAQACDLLAE